jgi:hypothetical protein
MDEKQKLIKQTKAVTILGTSFMLMLSFVFCVKAEPIPTNEKQMIKQVADEYNLRGDSRTLLFVIRILERGSVGREFGVLTPQAMRYPDNPQKSFITQCRWAAGTIKKRYNGNLKEFADRWCPIGAENDPTGLNKNFYGNTLFWMEKLTKRKILDG